MIFVQDILSRAVYWIFFPALAALFMILFAIQHHSLNNFWLPATINVSFLLIQLLAVSLWFSIKERHWVNITGELLGWGDVLFLICTACCFSPLNFFVFYIGSLLLVLLIWLVGKSFWFRNSPHIPLAGLQALILLLVFVVALIKPHLDLYADNWLINTLQQ